MMLWGSSLLLSLSKASSTVIMQLSSEQLPVGGGTGSGVASGKGWGRMEGDGSGEKALCMYGARMS